MKRASLLLLVLLAACRDAAPTATHLAMTLSRDHLRAGDDVVATVTALNADGNRATNYRGDFKLTVDGQAEHPNPSFDAAAAGELQVHLRIFTAGLRHVGAESGSFGVEAKAQVDVGDPASLAIVSGDAQAQAAATLLELPLTVHVQDAFGNDLPGAQVTFTPPVGGLVQPAVATADAKGIAYTAATLSSAAGAQVFHAQCGSAGADFHATGQAQAAVALVLVAGDSQVGVGQQPLDAPFVVRAIDATGNAVANADVYWSATEGASVTPPHATTGPDGTTRAIGTLGSGPFNATFTAQLGTASVTFHAAPKGLSYGDPPAGAGSIRLEYAGPGATPGSIALRLVTARAVSGFTVGFDLPLQGSRVSLRDFQPGTALPAGSNPVAAKAVISSAGPLAGMLVAAQSQKRAGAGAVSSDTALPADATLFTFTLAPRANVPTGVVFDGQAPGFTMQAGLLNLAGTEVVAASGFAVGRLELH